jgi:hypothetical protein
MLSCTDPGFIARSINDLVRQLATGVKTAAPPTTLDARCFSIQKYGIQPVDFCNRRDGSEYDDLPDHVEGELNSWKDACVKLLECYFAAKQVRFCSHLYTTKLT